MHRIADYKVFSAVILLLSCLSVVTACDTPPAANSKQSEIPNANSPGSNNILRFNGVCDGSAAVLLSNDNLLVAYDEQNALFEFSSGGGNPLREHGYAKALGIKPEVDVEAAAVIDEHIWWIGSHGNDGDGNQALSRQQLFKTLVRFDADLQSRVEVVAGSIDLLPVLLRQGIPAGLIDRSQKKRKPKKGGINIEGLSAMENGNLLVGLRSPLTGGDSGNAIIAQVDLSASQPTVVRFYTLDLGNRGVRDIQTSENGFLLMAGDVDSGGEFSIYRWGPAAKPERLLDLPAHFNAEALVYTGKQWLVMSDDGKVKRSDKSAKDEDRRCDSIRRKNPLADQHPSVFFGHCCSTGKRYNNPLVTTLNYYCLRFTSKKQKSRRQFAIN